MKETGNELNLETRNGLPEALQVLAKEYPKEVWETHQNFEGLVRFWLDRHLMFRKILQMMLTDLEALDSLELGPDQYRPRLARLGNMLVSELHTHHTIEDNEYFPRLQVLDMRLERGFQILDADHHALDAHLIAFTKKANLALQSHQDEIQRGAMALHDNLSQLHMFLNRHLLDEEELIVPVILKYGFRG